MTILLDIDGVLVTTPSWQTVDIHEDGFLKFNERAAKNLSRIVDQINASIVLTTTHRINYSLDKWKELLNTRGIYPICIYKINNISSLHGINKRAQEIQDWVNKQPIDKRFVIIDDDLSLNSLPSSIKDKCVLTKPMIGLDNDTTEKVLHILLDQ